MHADRLGVDLAALPRPSGGDYMRMWTKVLVEDPDLPASEADAEPWGAAFDAFYFLGSADMHRYFTRGGAETLTAGIEEYFARKYTMDGDFRQHFAWPEDSAQPHPSPRKARGDFFRFYGIRASTAVAGTESSPRKG